MSQIDNILTRLEKAQVEGVQVAGAWLAGALKQLVDTQCDFVNHSPIGGPPYKETGAGQASIGFQHIENGVRVGTEPIIETRPRTNPLENHLTWHDPGFGGGQRPWLSTAIERYSTEIQKIVSEVVKSKMVAR